jgi:indolepyruvate ferredoxin oxidoreductase beta subunit
MGRWILGSPFLSRALTRMTGGRQINTSRVGGYLMLYVLAGLRRRRRGTLRFQEENARIERWLVQVGRAASSDYDLAVEIAEAQRLVKGYGTTHERGVRHFEQVMGRAAGALGEEDAALRVRELCTAATADEEGTALSQALASWPLPANSLSAVP